jgi:hypothetical protein
MAEDTAPVVIDTPAPVEANVEAPVVVETPVESVVEQPAPVEATPEAPKTETLLGEAMEKPAEEAPKVEESAPKAEEVAPVEGQPTEEVAQPDEGGQTEDPAPPPKYEPFTLPDGVTVDEGKLGEFHAILSELELEGKADHAMLQAKGQKLVDFHINEVKNAVTNITELYQKTWEKQKTDWKESVVKDPELGGNRLQTSIDTALNFIRTHGGTSEQQQEFRELMESSGLGNHPAVIRLFVNAGRTMSEGKPMAAPKPIMQSKSRTQTMYGKGK